MKPEKCKNSKAILSLLFIYLQLIFMAGAARPDYIIVDTNQLTCFDNSNEITCPATGEVFYGQDSQYDGTQPAYRDNGDGTVTDLGTGLMWQQSPDINNDGNIDIHDKLTFAQAVAGASSFNLAGYNDWRLPSIKELYSLMDFSGANGTSAMTSVPYINTDYFDFEYGDESAGERFIDAQYCSSAEYVGTIFDGQPGVFGVNFADGRIKCYPRDTGHGGSPMDFFVRYARDNTAYGTNNFIDNGDGTITDRTTALMWQQNDNGSGKNWQDALAYAESLELAGYDDWRLPNAKELHSIVDYTRSPSTTSSAAIDPSFKCTSIIDEGGATNYPFFWTSTTHKNGPDESYAAYIAFGEALGYMQQPPMSGNHVLMDVHGAGAQRSDPKSGNPNDYPYGHGPQGDVIRIYNFVRCVRGQSTAFCRELVDGGDMDCDCNVDAIDFARFARDWLQAACGNCRGADLTDDGSVDLNDLTKLCSNWLFGL